MPLTHIRCCVFKVHGDYLDTRIRNTPAELESYPKEFDSLLDRIFDDFGLILCGWSAEWDTALRAAIERTVSRRFSHFWAVRGEPGNSAKRLIEHRQAQKLPIADADNFFSELGRLVDALEQFARPHPLSTVAAVTSLKGYLADHKYRIRLNDLVSSEVDRVLDATSGPAFTLQSDPAPDNNTFTARVRAYEAASETLVAMAAVGGYWVEDWHYATWKTALTRLAIRHGEDCLSLWVELQPYPSTLMLYALGLGAVEADERGLLFIGELFGTTLHRENKKDKAFVELLPPFCLFERGGEPATLLEGLAGHRVPLSDWLFALMQLRFQSLFSSVSRFAYAFDRLEILISLSYAHYAKIENDWTYVPKGRYCYREDSLGRILKELRLSIESFGEKSPYVRSGIFGNSAAECCAKIEGFTSWIWKSGGF
jgi:hypothetical protein